MFSVHKLKDRNTIAESIISIGNYDGLHLGHQLIINNMLECSIKTKLPVVIITFNPHTNEVLYNTKNHLLMSLNQKIKKMKDFNLNYLCIVDFNEEIAKMEVDEFMSHIIKKYNPKFIYFGYDNKFGFKRRGSYDYFLNNNKFKNILPIKCDEYLHDNENVKSTKIKKLIESGKLIKANKLLGYKYNIAGNIIKGDNIGSSIGFPTANLSLEEDKQLIPANGVYSVNLIVDSNNYTAICNIGIRPTFNISTHLRIEIHVLNIDDINLYEKKVIVEFNYKIRDEIKFDNIKDLKEQIKNDILSLN